MTQKAENKGLEKRKPEISCLKQTWCYNINIRPNKISGKDP